MQTIYALEFRGGDPTATLNYCLQELAPKIIDTNFPRQLLDGVLTNRSAIKNLIESKAPNWPFDKIAPIDRAILQIGVYELYFTKDTPKAVIINEAIELAKSHGGENCAKFINGVLSTLAEELPSSLNDQTPRA